MDLDSWVATSAVQEVLAVPAYLSALDQQAVAHQEACSPQEAQELVLLEA